ncbi:MAG: hypothetical protein IH948_07140, partial [Bacteroidetes bacterium]|nr:hypothetical protein [Bacteroidota bacterium]
VVHLFEDVNSTWDRNRTVTTTLLYNVTNVHNFIAVPRVYDFGNLTESFGSIQRALHNMEKASINVNSMVFENRVQVKGIIDDARHLTTKLRGNSNELSATIKNFKSISDSIADADITATINSVNKTFDQLSVVLEDLNKGQGTLGKLLKDSVLYKKIKASVIDFDLLLKDLKENPRVDIDHHLFHRDKQKRALEKMNWKKFKKNKKAIRDSINNS